MESCLLIKNSVFDSEMSNYVYKSLLPLPGMKLIKPNDLFYDI